MSKLEPERDEHGMEVVELRHPSGSSVRVHLQGAHVTSWRTADGRERLFLSRAARFQQGVAIRGGIPVIFPQFADRGPLAKHGFARLSRWRLTSDGDEGVARFALEDSEDTRSAWPERFLAELEVSLGERHLAVELAVTARTPLVFTAALHSYLRVADVTGVEIEGLEGASFDSRSQGVERAVQGQGALRVAGELDRVYFDVRDPLRVRDPVGGGQMVVEGEGFPDVVVWNPGPERARSLGDLAPEEWRQMLCVEAAVIGRPVHLDAGARWRARQLLRVAG